jgi:hypothetical protein
MPFPPFIDLESLADSLSKTGKHATLQKALIQAWRAESCLGDLVQAKQCCEVLREHVKPGPKTITAEQHTTERALLTTGVLLYVRGTSTSAKAGERGSIQLERGQLTKEQWRDHQALIDLRNQALAHVNAAHYAGSRIWHRVILFAVRNSFGAWRPASATNETGFHRETFERLERMLPVASELILAKFNRRMTAVTERLNEANIDEPTFFKHQFDPTEVFGSEEAVRRLLKGSSRQSDAFWVSE